MSFWTALWAELKRPSTLPPGPLGAAYQRGIIGMAHMAIGAAAASLVAPELVAWGAVARVGIIALYWVGKEAGDLRRGGTLADGIEDAACVGLGAWTFSPWAVLALGLWLMWRGYAGRA